MPVFKRKGSSYYYYEFIYSGRRYRASTGTPNRQEAEQVEAREKLRLWEQEKLGVKEPHPWSKALAKFLRAKKDLATLDEYIFSLQVLTDAFNRVNPDMTLEEINRDIVESIFEEYQEAHDCTDARVNRMTSHVRSLLNMAANEWGWIDHAPRLKFYREKKKEPRWLTIHEAKELIKHAPAHLQDPIRFSLLTGVRKANCLGLKWQWISMEAKRIVVPAINTKTEQTISIPITSEVRALLLRNLGKHDENVFTYRDRPFYTIDNKYTWKPLIKKAGIKKFRWHDLRHTWASWHIMNGTSPSELMELAGWSSHSMVKRYAHLSVEHLRKAAGNVSIKEDFGELLTLKK